MFKKIKKSIPFCIRSEYFRIKRGIYNIFFDKKIAKNKVLDNSNYPNKIFFFKTKLIKNYPEPWYSTQINKINNLQIAIKKINGIILSPNEIFSFWKLVGRPYFLKGYKKAMVIKEGNVSVGMAGGLCQISNLLYFVCLNLGFKVLERHRHSYDLFPDTNRTVPFGTGATVLYNYLDLRFQNNTPETYIFNLYLDDQNLNIEVCANQKPQFTYKIIEKDAQFLIKNNERFRLNKIYRKKLALDGNLIEEILILENKCRVLY